MTSLWLDKRNNQPIPSDTFEPGARYDVVVAGAGLTGLMTALLMARAGLSVMVLEARFIGAVTTGNSTAKLSLLQGSVLSEIAARGSKQVLRAYVEANLEGQQWMLRYLEEHGVEVQHRDAFTYTTTPSAVAAIDDEFAACRAAGLDVERADDIGLPFETSAAIKLNNQTQFNPMDVLHALAADVREHGGLIVEGARVKDVDVGEPSTVSSSLGDIQATTVVLATGIPILDRGLYFAKVKPSRSYAQAFRVPDGGANLPRGMYLSLDSPARSLRTAPIEGEELLIVGGNGHTVGRDDATFKKVEDLENWTQQYFSGAVRTHSWSAQDYESLNKVPFVGWMPRTHQKVALATGYNKWGMTNAVAAALSIAADVLGGNMPWANTLHHRITLPKDVSSGVAANAEVAAELSTGWASAELHALPEEAPVEGAGIVGRRGLKPTAVSTVNGKVCHLSAVCTHLGGVLSWNTAEQSWDCPLHGSRFDSEGRLLEGPATDDLEVLADEL